MVNNTCTDAVKWNDFFVFAPSSSSLFSINMRKRFPSRLSDTNNPTIEPISTSSWLLFAFFPIPEKRKQNCVIFLRRSEDETIDDGGEHELFMKPRRKRVLMGKFLNFRLRKSGERRGIRAGAEEEGTGNLATMARSKTRPRMARCENFKCHKRRKLRRITNDNIRGAWSLKFRFFGSVNLAKASSETMWHPPVLVYAHTWLHGCGYQLVSLLSTPRTWQNFKQYFSLIVLSGTGWCMCDCDSATLPALTSLSDARILIRDEKCAHKKKLFLRLFRALRKQTIL